MVKIVVRNTETGYDVLYEEATSAYRIAAVVSKAGNIKWRVSIFEMPDEVHHMVCGFGSDLKREFRNSFELLSIPKQLRAILNELPADRAFEWMDDCRGLREKLPLMREEYYQVV